MYENLSLKEYLEKMDEWDNKRAKETQDWIEEHWIPGDTFIYPNGTMIQYRDFRGDNDGISKTN